jgi:hypothetical protein
MTSYDSTIGAMTGIIPVALAGGITIGLTKAALEIPEDIERRRTARRTTRRVTRRAARRSARSPLSEIFGPSNIL